MNLETQVVATIQKHGLLPAQTHVLLGVSGGADSVAMAHVLHAVQKRLRITLSLAHLHHGMRGRDADGDAQFVCELASRLKVPCYEGRKSVPRIAQRKGWSLEMAAREARYRFFVDTARSCGADAVATAHTLDDQAETVLLRLARGSGPQGLGGIRYATAREGLRLIRPMLDVCHADAVQYLERKHEAWREDASNRDLDFLRNRVRHEILPLLEERLNPNIRKALVRCTDIMREEDQWLDEEARTLLAGASDGEALVMASLRKYGLGARRRVLRLWLIGHGIDPVHVDFDALDRLEGLTSTTRGSSWIPLGGSWRVSRSYGRLSVSAHATPDSSVVFHVRLKVPGETLLPERGLRVVIEPAVGVGRLVRGRVGALPAEGWLARKPAGRAALYLRSPREGDRIKPIGMTGSKKLQDLFVDSKVPREERGRCPVLQCRDTVVWVAGHGPARGWEVPDADAASWHVRVEAL